ncbi:MAG: GIY-YIG nuclease family protein [Candidatus Paceibacterota bacterium]
MFYTIYKTTNLINNKFYIGKYQTQNINDGYLGSGKLLKRAIKKYGLDNFKKEIILECSNEQEMNLAEKILVVIDEMSYNLTDGGRGGMELCK